MNKLLLIPAFALLVACDSVRDRTETYTCPIGPDLSVAFSDDGARIVFPTGRVELLPPTEDEDFYAKPGVVFDARPFRTARLTDGQQSFQCDQMAG